MAEFVSVSGFLVSLANLYEAGAVPLDPLALARKCRDYATIAQHEWEPKPSPLALPDCAALPEMPAPLPPPIEPSRSKKPQRPRIF